MSYQSCLYCFQQCRQPTAFYRTSLSSFKYLDTFYRCGRDSDHISEIFVQKMNQFIIFRSLVTNSVTILETSAQEPEKSPCLDRADVSPCSDWSTPADDSNYCAPVGQWATCSQWRVAPAMRGMVNRPPHGTGRSWEGRIAQVEPRGHERRRGPWCLWRMVVDGLGFGVRSYILSQFSQSRCLALVCGRYAVYA